MAPDVDARRSRADPFAPLCSGHHHAPRTDLIFHALVGVHRTRDVVDELDDLCCRHIRRGGLARKDVRRRSGESLTVFGHAQVVIGNAQQIEELALVFVKAFDVDVEH